MRTVLGRRANTVDRTRVRRALRRLTSRKFHCCSSIGGCNGQGPFSRRCGLGVKHKARGGAFGTSLSCEGGQRRSGCASDRDFKLGLRGAAQLAS